MMTLTKTSSVQTIVKSEEHHRTDFLQEVIEGLEDGILILNYVGEILHANTSAYRICCQLTQDDFISNFVPTAIWNLCQALLDKRSLLPDELIILSDEIVLNESTIFQIRVRLLDLNRFQMPCLLVTIENRCESLKNVAIAEVEKYDFTPREAEIWCLYRANYSYKEIAAKLYITINTVKKHMKNIHAKRQLFMINHH